MTSVSTEEMEFERSQRLDDAFSNYVAQMMGVRPMLYVQTGEVVSLVGSDPPVPDRRVATCRSCEGAMRGRDSGRVFCAACRAKPQVLRGSPIIETMYLSAHPKYELNEETEALVACIGQQRETAAQSQLVARQLAYQSYTVSAISGQNQGDRNVYFTPESVSNCSYGEEVTRCNPKYVEEDGGVAGKGASARHHLRHPAVTVGGLGLKLCDVVKHLVTEWLYNLDAMIRAQFDIPLEHRPNDAFVLSTVPEFAQLIAKRVVLLEGPHDDPETQLCTRVFEQVAKIQIATCELHASRRVRADIRAMRELSALVRDRDIPPNTQHLIDFLVAPCPELLKALPTVAMDMRFAELTAALQGAGDCTERVGSWRLLVGEGAAGALDLLLPTAIEAVQKWRPSPFVNCLRYDASGASRPLPAQRWVDNPHVALWSLVSRATHSRRRMGLDPTGMRIVLMSSALMQLNGDGRFFVPGVMHHAMMNKVCIRHESVATYAYNALSEQIWPYMMGEPWRKSRSQLVNWKGSHIEDDVRLAVASLGGFSVDEIVGRFARSASSMDQARKDAGIVRMTTDKMVHKPKPQYDQWFTVCVDLLLPILAQLRQSSGISSGVAPSALGEVLRLLRSVREWKPSDGALKVVAGEAAFVPQVKSALVRLKGEGSTLVKYTRPARSKVMLWAFDPDELVRVLNQ